MTGWSVSSTWVLLLGVLAMVSPSGGWPRLRRFARLFKRSWSESRNGHESADRELETGPVEAPDESRLDLQQGEPGGTEAPGEGDASRGRADSEEQSDRPRLTLLLLGFGFLAVVLLGTFGLIAVSLAKDWRGLVVLLVVAFVMAPFVRSVGQALIELLTPASRRAPSRRVSRAVLRTLSLVGAVLLLLLFQLPPESGLGSAVREAAGTVAKALASFFGT